MRSRSAATQMLGSGTVRRDRLVLGGRYRNCPRSVAQSPLVSVAVGLDTDEGVEESASMGTGVSRESEET
jgi:hypothetical protein